MSTASQANLLAAAQVANAIAASMTTMPAGTSASNIASTVATIVTSLGPVVNPQIGLAITLAGLGFKAIEAAASTGQGLTPAEWALLIGADDAAIAADAAARAAQTPA